MKKGRREATVEGNLDRLKAYSRDPFMEKVAEFLASSPSEAKIKKWAEQYPDRWAGAVTALAKIAGFSEKRESVNLSLVQHVNLLSDGALEQQLSQALATLGISSSTDGPPTDIVEQLQHLTGSTTPNKEGINPEAPTIIDHQPSTPDTDPIRKEADTL